MKNIIETLRTILHITLAHQTYRPLVKSVRINGVMVAFFSSAFLAACGGGSPSQLTSPSSTPTSHVVSITWVANAEAAVNSPGGGYQVNISGMPTILVPFPYDPAGPSATMALTSGNYTATVTAYSTMNPSTGIPVPGTLSTSAPTVLAINVP
ncbi:MAG: hypothetical protein WCD45_02195 [Gallionella sp.]